MMPVRREERSRLENSGWPSWAMNMVGTPWTAVHRSAEDGVQGLEGIKVLGGE